MSSDNLTLGFDKWKRLVNICVVSKAGLGCDDLPDFDYFSAFHDGSTPAETAEQVLRDVCEEMGFDYEETFG